MSDKLILSKMKNRKAMSQVITALILVGIVLVSAGVVWYVYNNVINSQKGQIASYSDCFGASFEIKSVVPYYSWSNYYDVAVERKVGGENVIGARVVLSDGTVTLTKDSTGTFDVLTTQTISVIGSLSGSSKTAKVYALVGSGSETFICPEPADEYSF